MLYSASLREMMQNAVNETFWDARSVEIEACANFKRKIGIRDLFPGSWKESHNPQIFSDWMLWDPTDPENRFCHFFAGAVNFAGWAKMLENRACPNLDAMSVPEALV